MEGATKGLPQLTFSRMVKILELWWQAGSCCQSDILKICIINQISRGQSGALLGNCPPGPIHFLKTSYKFCAHGHHVGDLCFSLAFLILASAETMQKAILMGTYYNCKPPHLPLSDQSSNPHASPSNLQEFSNPELATLLRPSQSPTVFLD